MITVVSGTLHEGQFVRQFAGQMFELRYKVFHKRLGWKVFVNHGHEIDEFDDNESVYLLTTEGSAVVGGWRLRPTVRPYMLKNVFPELLYGREAPEDRTIWEISRFAVHGVQSPRPNYGFGRASRALLLETVRFAAHRGVSQYLMVVSVAVERLLRSFGLRLHRFGPPMRVGHVMSVAVWLDVDLHTRSLLLGESLPLLAAA